MKQPQGTVKFIEFPCYASAVYLAFGKDVTRDDIAAVAESHGCKRVGAEYGTVKALRDPNSLAETAMLSCDAIVIAFKDANPKPKIIVHECFHAVADLLPRLGIPWSDVMHEVYAYAMEALFRAITEAVPCETTTET